MTPFAVVTGAPGWLGTRLVHALLEDIPGIPTPRPADPDRRVRCLVRPGLDARPLQRLSPRVEIVEGDLTRPRSLDPLFLDARGATVFHAAGVIHPTAGIRQLYDVNVSGTRNLLAAARAAGAGRFIHVSSNSPTGCNRRADEVFDESAPYNPYMHYGRSKKIAEDLVNQAGRSGIDTVIIRPPWFYGPNQPYRQGLFFTMIRNGTVPLVGDGENRRSMAYIDNICQALLRCEQVAAARGQTYWIADRRPYPMKEILSSIEAVMHTDFRVQVARRRLRIPGFVGDCALLLDRVIQGLGLYSPKVHVLSEMNKTIACSITRAERELGYDPQIDLCEGIRRSLSWMIAQGIPW